MLTYHLTKSSLDLEGPQDEQAAFMLGWKSAGYPDRMPYEIPTRRYRDGRPAHEMFSEPATHEPTLKELAILAYEVFSNGYRAAQSRPTKPNSYTFEFETGERLTFQSKQQLAAFRQGRQAFSDNCAACHATEAKASVAFRTDRHQLMAPTKTCGL